jgi:replicative DNA helicase
MSQTELAQRFVASQAKIDGDALRKGKVKKDRWPAVLKAAGELSEAPLWIDDSSDINILELRAKARRLHGKAMGQNGVGLGMVIIDYLQLLRANDSRESRVEQVSQMSRGLKILARELNIPVIAVSQLSRAVESRPGARPQLSDLRESGQIEQDADLVGFIYREDYYLREESQRPGEAARNPGDQSLGLRAADAAGAADARLRVAVVIDHPGRAAAMRAYVVVSHA